MKRTKVNWLDRRIAAPGPFLALCLSAEEFDSAINHLGVRTDCTWVNNTHSNATAHYFDHPDGRGLVCVVCLRGHESRTPIEVAGLLVHEAVHVWQAYAENIGEDKPGVEQEAYAVQSIAQELMAEFARRMS